MPPHRPEPSTPSFDLSVVHELAESESGIITSGASDGAASLGYFNHDIWWALEDLSQEDFYKTDIWHNHPDKMVDVYYIQVGEHSIYLKFSIVSNDEGEQRLIVSSFKENYHL